MRIISSILLLSIITSCATRRLSSNTKEEIQKICLTGEGRGRLHVNGRKYVFSYESLLESKINKWSLALDFPLRDPEVLYIEWDTEGNSSFKSTIETKILKENRGLNPKELERFVNGLGSLLQDIVRVQNDLNQSKKIKWNITSKELMGVGSDVQAIFTNLKGQYFGQMSIADLDNFAKGYKIEFIVRNCGE